MSEQLEKRIQVLERKLKREKEAKAAAEALLEEKSETLYDANQELQQQIAEAKQEQKQLAFLTGLSAETWRAKNIDAIVKLLLRKSIDFLNKAQAAFIKIEFVNDIWQLQELSTEQENDDKVDLEATITKWNFSQLVEILRDGEFESQILSYETFSDLPENSGYAFFLPIFHFKQQIGVAAFLYEDSELIDIYKLQTMESARTTVDVAIQQKLTAMKLAGRYSELKKTYEQLHDTQQQLAQSEKMASLGQLAAGVAHEINNPVGYVLSNYETLAEYIEVMNQVISLNAEMIHQQSDNPSEKVVAIKDIWEQQDIDFIQEDLEELIGASKSGLKRVQEIVSGLKVFTHVSDAENKDVDLQDCIRDALQLVSNELKYEHKVETEFDDVALIKGKSGALQQVFVNMLMNAKQAMESGGTITVKTEQIDDKARVVIADSGCGIAKEDLDKLFTPFFTTKPVGVGTGLGLSISYGILTDHGAEVDVQSEVGKGTQFIMDFPTEQT